MTPRCVTPMESTLTSQIGERKTSTRMVMRPVHIDFAAIDSNRDIFNRSAQGNQRPKFVTLQPLHKNLIKKGFDFDSDNSPNSLMKLRVKMQQSEESKQE